MFSIIIKYGPRFLDLSLSLIYDVYDGVENIPYDDGDEETYEKRKH